MFYLKAKKMAITVFTLALMVVTFLAPLSQVKAADHADSTSVAGDPGADIGDVFAFLDPNDNSRVILAMDVEGFVVPSELLNLSFFSPDVLYRFEIENTGDAVADLTIDVTFSPQTSRSAPQTAVINIPKGFRRGAPPFGRFTAPTTVQTLNPTANPFVVTTDPFSRISFLPD